MDGLSRCTRYAFAPNRLHLCGPDKSSEIYSYLSEGETDKGLEILLSQFKTMYPYLRQIAHSNKINDPLDEKVVDAYWIGNSLLDNVLPRQFWRNAVEDHMFHKRFDAKSFRILESKIGQNALMHHSFHVLNIMKRTGYSEKEHTIESMDACRISWGKVLKISGPFIDVEYSPLKISGHQIIFSSPITKRVARSLGDDATFDDLKIGDSITMHWDWPCEIITPAQAKRLEHYTKLSINFANQTL